MLNLFRRRRKHNGSDRASNENEGGKVNPSPGISPDAPLTDPSLDRLGLAEPAANLARGLVAMAPAQSFVVAVYGSWGSGKSTFIEFMLRTVESADEPPAVLRFNPWWFSGREDLVARFFDLLLAYLDSSHARKTKLYETLEQYAGALAAVPAVGGGLRNAAASAAGGAVGRRRDVHRLNERLGELLAEHPQRILVVIDDVDRLDNEEVRDLFRVVKAVANLPNMTYVMALDKQVVTAALAGSAFDGFEYLEKIVQVPIELPLPSRELLRRMLFEQLDVILAADEGRLWDSHHWGNVFVDGIDHFMRLPRQVRRLINTLSLAYPTVRGEVNPVDFIGMETLRVFVPSVYDQIRLHPDMFTGPQPQGHDILGGREVEQLRTFHESWLAQIDERHRDATKALATRMFPKLLKVWGHWMSGSDDESTWRRRLRVCHPEILPAYLRLAIPSGEVTAAEVRATVSALDGDVGAVVERIKRVPDMLPRLGDSLDDLSIDQAERLIAALFAVGDHLLGSPDQRAWDTFDSTDLRLIRLLLPLTKRLNESGRGERVRQLLDVHAGVATATTFASWIGSQHGRRGDPWEEQAVDDEEATRIEQAALAVIRRTAGHGDLVRAPSRGMVIYRWKDWAGADEPKAWAQRLAEGSATEVADLLSCFVQESRSSSAGDRIDRQHFRLDPKAVAQFVDVDALDQRVPQLLADLDEEQRRPLELFIAGRKLEAMGRDTSDPFAWRYGDAD